MEIKGKIKLKAETQTFDSGFIKRQLVITTYEQYPQDIAMDFFKDKTSLLDSWNIGDSVTVSINIRGNEYNGKYYVSLQGWKIEANTDAHGASNEPQAAPVATSNEPDDLPF